jgi:hypothetical protein
VVAKVIKASNKANAKKLAALKVKNMDYDTKRALADIDKQKRAVTLLQKQEWSKWSSCERKMKSN